VEQGIGTPAGKEFFTAKYRGNEKTYRKTTRFSRGRKG